MQYRDFMTQLKAEAGLDYEQIHSLCVAGGSAAAKFFDALKACSYALQHSEDNLVELATRFSVKLSFSADKHRELYLLSLFHDIGKIGVPQQILLKPAPLNDMERHIMQQHTVIGYRIAQEVPQWQPIASYILGHHEWWDGSGYPHGLQGEDIPEACQIMAIIDAYDAMTSNRPYRRAMTCAAACQELRDKAGRQFSPQMVEVFLEVIGDVQVGWSSVTEQ